jgi:hypothetical protein
VKLVVVAVAVALTLGCGSVPGIGHTPASVTIAEAQNGQTVDVQVGARITLQLHSTYWQIAGSSDTGVVKPLSAPTAVPSPGCYPGMGCGTVAQDFQAVRAGEADIMASRGSCGEARRCVGSEGVYRVTIAVA